MQRGVFARPARLALLLSSRCRETSDLSLLRGGAASKLKKNSGAQRWHSQAPRSASLHDHPPGRGLKGASCPTRRGVAGRGPTSRWLVSAACRGATFAQPVGLTFRREARSGNDRASPRSTGQNVARRLNEADDGDRVWDQSIIDVDGLAVPAHPRDDWACPRRCAAAVPSANKRKGRKHRGHD